MSLGQLWQELRIRAQPLYKPLSTGDQNGHIIQPAQWRQFLPRGRRSLLAICGIILVYLAGNVLRRPPHLDLESLKALRHAIEPSAGYLHVLVPSGDANSRFCRSALSSSILGYPFPLALNWGGEDNDDAFGDASWEWGKFQGTLKYLKLQSERRADDLVLISDGEDSWFQLKPEVLIKRYREITKQAEERLYESLGGVRPGVKKPEIIFAAQKRCHAVKKDHIGCYAAPDPPQFATMSSGDEYDPFLSDPRPRFLTSAMMMGTVSSLLALHQAAWERWHNNPTLFSSRDDLFASLFGEQEYQRSQLRTHSLSFLQRLSRYFSSSDSEPSFIHPPPTSIMYAKNLTTADYGVTLDYASLLAHIPDGLGDWIRFSDPQSLFNGALAANLSSTPLSTEISKSITHSRPPLWSLAPYSSAYPFEYDDLPTDLPWSHVPLYTNLATSITPVIIINRDSGDDEDTLKKAWRKMWFTPYTRKKLQNIAYEPVVPLATTPLQGIPQHVRDSIDRHTPGAHRKHRPLGEKQWWSYVDVTPINKGREGIGFLINGDRNIHQEGWKRWGDTCEEGVQGEILGDGKGRWVDIKVYPPFPDLEKGSL